MIILEFARKDIEYFNLLATQMPEEILKSGGWEKMHKWTKERFCKKFNLMQLKNLLEAEVVLKPNVNDSRVSRTVESIKITWDGKTPDCNKAETAKAIARLFVIKDVLEIQKKKEEPA